MRASGRFQGLKKKKKTIEKFTSLITDRGHLQASGHFEVSIIAFLVFLKVSAYERWSHMDCSFSTLTGTSKLNKKL